MPADEIAAAARRLAVRPVFTAHPTEAARRSILSKLRAVADDAGRRGAPPRSSTAPPTRTASDPPPRRADRPALADRRAAAGPAGPDRRGPQRRLLPRATCTPTPPRRCSTTSPRRCASSAWRPPPTARPLTFGIWIGGDRDGNPFVTPAVTRDVLLIQHEHGIQATERAMDALIDELSVSRRLRGVSLDLSASLAERPGRPARGGAPVPPDQRRGAVPAQGALHQGEAGQHPRPGCASGTAHVPGRDYLGTDELIADLELMRASLARNAGQLTAVGAAGLGDPHGVRVRPAAGHAGRARARRDAPRGAGPAVRAGRRGRRLRRAGPRRAAPSCSPTS